MEEYEYKGFTIVEDYDGYFKVANYTFISLDEAMDWVDAQVDDLSDDEPITRPSKKNYKYIFFYIDRATDSSFEACIEAPTYKEAERKLRKNYDVYHISDFYVIE